VAIANALQLDAARRRPSLHPL